VGTGRADLRAFVETAMSLLLSEPTAPVWQVGFSVFDVEASDVAIPDESRVRAVLAAHPAEGVRFAECVDAASGTYLVELAAPDAERLAEDGYIEIRVGDLILQAEMP
jgi:hypothetical protein